MIRAHENKSDAPHRARRWDAKRPYGIPTLERRNEKEKSAAGCSSLRRLNVGGALAYNLSPPQVGSITSRLGTRLSLRSTTAGAARADSLRRRPSSSICPGGRAAKAKGRSTQTTMVSHVGAASAATRPRGPSERVPGHPRETAAETGQELVPGRGRSRLGAPTSCRPPAAGDSRSRGQWRRVLFSLRIQRRFPPRRQDVRAPRHDGGG
jgi:hypothetical protein